LGGVSHPASEAVSCNSQIPTCTLFTYSDWSSCSLSGTQSRTITSSSPAGCQGGDPDISRSCQYTPTCVSGQIIECDNVANGVVMGHKDRCNDASGEWLNENTCQLTCNSGFYHDFDRCILPSEKTEFTIADLNIETTANNMTLRDKIQNKTLLAIFNLTDESKLNQIKIIRSNISDSREYIIVSNLSLEANQTKTIYLEKKNQNSNAVCINDSNVESLSEISAGCTETRCPGVYGNYRCEIEGNVLIVSGLKHSGVVEDYMYCGDNRCVDDETCTSCSADCGSCPIAVVPAAGTTGGPGSGTVRSYCGDGACRDRETCTSCPRDCNFCTACNNNGICNSGETCGSCPADCRACPAQPVCGAKGCEAGETCSSCPADCGACPVAPQIFCGDGSCQSGAGETCTSCSADCGACPTATWKKLLIAIAIILIVILIGVVAVFWIARARKRKVPEVKQQQPEQPSYEAQV
jgi:hypothetical protein